MSSALQGDVAWQFTKTATTPKEALELAARAKEEGNKCFKGKAFDKAVAYYRTGLTKLRSAHARKLFSTKSAEEKQAAVIETSFHLNIAMCLVKTKQWEEAITAATAALRKDPNSSKALLYRARGYLNSAHRQNEHGLARARSDLASASAANPSDKTIAAELASVEGRLEKIACGEAGTLSAAVSTAGASTSPSLSKTSGAAAAAANASAPEPQRILTTGADDEEAEEADEEIRRAFKRGTVAAAAAAGAAGDVPGATETGTQKGAAASEAVEPKVAGGIFHDERSDRPPPLPPSSSSAALLLSSPEQPLLQQQGVFGNSNGNGNDSLNYRRFDRIVDEDEHEAAAVLAAEAAGVEAARSAELEAKRLQLQAEAEAAREEAEDLAAVAEAKGYRVRLDGSKVPAWSRHGDGDGGDRATAINAKEAKSKTGGVGGGGGGAVSVLPTPPPQRISGGGAPAFPTAATSTSAKAAARSVAGYNRSYRERDMTSWCVTGLLGRALRPVSLALPHCEGTLRTFPPRDLRGDALMVGKLGKWDHTFDFSFSVAFEAKMGKPRTAEVVVKGKKQRMFLGIPTYRGFLRFPDVSHLQDAAEYDVEVLWDDAVENGGPMKKGNNSTQKQQKQKQKGKGKAAAAQEAGSGPGVALSEASEVRRRLAEVLSMPNQGVQGLLRRRLGKWAESYRSVEDPQTAIDLLVKATLMVKEEPSTSTTTSTTNSTTTETTETAERAVAPSPSAVTEAATGEAGVKEKEDSAPPDSRDEAPTLMQQLYEGPDNNGDVGAGCGLTAGEVRSVSLPTPWEWCSLDDLEATPADKTASQSQSSPSPSPPSPSSPSPSPPSPSSPQGVNGGSAGGGGGAAGGGDDGIVAQQSAEAAAEAAPAAPAAAFDPLKTPKMLNYMEKMAKEGYAVFVDEKCGDGEGDDDEDANEDEDGKKGKKSKKKRGKKKKKTREAGSLSSSIPLKRDPTAKAAGALPVHHTPTLPTPASRSSLDYSKFANIDDDEDDGEVGGRDAAANAFAAGSAGGVSGSGGSGSGGGALSLVDRSTVPPEFEQQFSELESNPLWSTVLELAKGDGAQALKLLEDPDALQKRPEIAKLFAAASAASLGEGGDDTEDDDASEDDGDDDGEDDDSDDEDEDKNSN